MKAIIITIDEARELFGQQFAKDCYFQPVLDADGNIIISELEMRKADKTKFPFLTNRENDLKDPGEILKGQSYEDWLLDIKTRLEAQIIKIEGKISK